MLAEDAREDGLSDIIGSARGRVKEYRNASLHFPPNGGYWAFPSPWKTCVCNNCKYTLIFTPIQAWCERSRVDWYVGRSGCRFYCDIQASLWRSRSGRSVLDICKGRLELLGAHVWLLLGRHAKSYTEYVVQSVVFHPEETCQSSSVRFVNVL